MNTTTFADRIRKAMFDADCKRIQERIAIEAVSARVRFPVVAYVYSEER